MEQSSTTVTGNDEGGTIMNLRDLQKLNSSGGKQED